MRFAEGDLEMDIPDVVDGGKFDGDGHGLNRCMKAVDFVVELADRYLFIEFKDPQHPHATPESRAEFIRRLDAGQLDEDLKTSTGTHSSMNGHLGAPASLSTTWF